MSAVITATTKRSRSVLRDAISSECGRVIEAGDNAEAYELSRRYVPDVIVLSGDGALAKIRRDGELADVPVICLAGPVDTAELTARIRAALHRA
jgi:DNA-binding response OmpR family regulator